MRAMAIFVGLTILGCTLPSGAIAAQRTFAGIRNYEFARITIDSSVVAGRLPATADAPLDVSFIALDREFRLRLTPGDLFDEETKTYVVRGGETVEIPTRNYTYQGTLRDEPTARVRVALIRGALKGRIVTKSGTYILQPHRMFDAGAREGDLVVYRATDSDEDAYECTVGDHWPDGLNLSVLDTTPQRLRSG